MASIPPSNGKTVLITGLNGYIASTIAQQLLEKGYTIRGTSRRASSTQHLLDGPFKPYADRVQSYSVPDMTVDGAFDEAVKGVHGIAHTASPIDFSMKEADLFIRPAVRGVEVLLESALSHAGPQLESIVITSSVASVVDRGLIEKYPTYEFDERNWNEFSLKMIEELGNDAPIPVMYGASKVAAEKAAWKFKQEKRPSFSISVCNPSVVTGPPPALPDKPEQLNETLAPVWSILGGVSPNLPPQIGTAGHVDVRDVAEGHVWCLEHPKESDGERYILINGQGKSQAMADVLHSLYPERSEIMVKGNPGEAYDKEYKFYAGECAVNNRKATEAMGLKWRRFDQSIKETAEMMAKKWL